MLGTTLKTGTNGNMKGAAQKSLSSWTSSSEQGLRMFDNATILEHIKPSKEINDVVERALDKLSKEEVDIPRLKNLNILDKEVGLSIKITWYVLFVLMYDICSNA